MAGLGVGECVVYVCVCVCVCVYFEILAIPGRVVYRICNARVVHTIGFVKNINIIIIVVFYTLNHSNLMLEGKKMLDEITILY